MIHRTRLQSESPCAMLQGLSLIPNPPEPPRMRDVIEHLKAITGRRRRWRDHLEKIGHVLLISAILRTVTRWIIGDAVIEHIAAISLVAWAAYLALGKIMWYARERPKRIARGETHPPITSAAAWKDIVGDGIITSVVPLLAHMSEALVDAPMLLTWAVAYYATQRWKWTD